MAKTGHQIIPKLVNLLDKPELALYDSAIEKLFEIVEGAGEDGTGSLDSDNIPDYKAEDPGDSTATTLEGIVADHNELLASLRSAGKI